MTIIPNLRISDKTKSRFDKCGKYGDSADTVLSRILDACEKTVCRTDLMNSVYRAIIPECERIEHAGSYKGNGHHLAQRLTEMVAEELLPKEKAQAQEVRT